MDHLASHAEDANSMESPHPLILSGHKSTVNAIAFLPDGNQFVSGSMDGTIRTWGTKQRREVRSAIDCDGTIFSMAVSNDGQWIAIGSAKWRIVLWHAKTHEKAGEWAKAHLGAIDCLAFSPDATKVVSGAGDTTVIVWHVPTGDCLAGPFRGHVDAIVSVVFSPDGDRVASTDLHDVRIWDASSGILVLPPIQLEVWSLAWAPPPNDQLLYASCDARIVSIDASTGSTGLKWTAHPLGITCIALSQDGQFITSSSNHAKTVQLWNTATQQECVPALQHRSYVRSVAVSPDASYVITGGDDHTICIWPLRWKGAQVDEEDPQSTSTIFSLEDDDNPEGTATVQEEPNQNTEKHFPNDLTNYVARDGHDPVASGGFADIYRGILQENGESIKVAIKAIKTYSGEDSDFTKKQKRLRREIKVWLNLRHLNVLPLLGTTLGFGRFPAMVCPWVENGPLTSYLEDRHATLSTVEVLSLLNNVASGLEYLHSRSVVHGDLSGSNILIRENGRAYIADFGLSMLLTELGRSTFATSFHARGTLRWTAPELLDLDILEDGLEEESPHVAPTIQSDVYSFGGIMLQILSGKIPYHYYTREAQVVHAVSRGMTPKRPRSGLVTERRWMFIQRCWSATARSRPSSEEVVEFIEKELASIGDL